MRNSNQINEIIKTHVPIELKMSLRLYRYTSTSQRPGKRSLCNAMSEKNTIKKIPSGWIRRSRNDLRSTFFQILLTKAKMRPAKYFDRILFRSSTNRMIQNETNKSCTLLSKANC